MVKKFTIPFASQGDANDIPDALQVDGKVSFTQGFGYDYERPYDDPQAKDIAREDMNGLFKAITSAVGELQTLGASEWSSAVSYPKGAIVYYEKDLYISQVDDNQNKPPQNWVSITSIANDSLKKAANLSDLTNKTTARNNLGLGSSSTLNKTDVLGTSTSLVATQKLVNDTKINLENSKQDKLTFVGSGKVMREGAYGLGGSLPTIPNGSDFNNLGLKSGAYFINGNANAKTMKNLPEKYQFQSVVRISKHADEEIQEVIHYRGNYYIYRTYYEWENEWSEWQEMRTNRNTSTDSSGFIRASGSKETFTKDLVTQSTGSSTTSVMSQKAVTDRLNAIESGHGLGYGQIRRDLTSSRQKGITYTNNNQKPIWIHIVVTDSPQQSGLSLTISGVKYEYLDAPLDLNRSITSIILPGENYLLETYDAIELWTEIS